MDRPALFEKSDARLPIRAHDLRGTFVTVALANGKTEAWVADRTGHRSSQMINTYRRTTRTYAELGLGELTPMVEAIPELRVHFEKAREKARATNTEAAEIAKLPESLVGHPGLEPGANGLRTQPVRIRNPLFLTIPRST